MDNFYPKKKIDIIQFDYWTDRRESMVFVVPSVVLLFTLIGIYQKKIKIGALGVVILLFVIALVFEYIF